MKRYSIVGQERYGFDKYLTGTVPGVTATLIREPENSFDPNAIMVFLGEKHVGYIPKKDNAALAAFIDKNGRDIATVGASLARTDSAAVATPHKAVDATFMRSPNSSYPQVKV